jgi:hypothetical protein
MTTFGDPMRRWVRMRPTAEIFAVAAATLERWPAEALPLKQALVKQALASRSARSTGSCARSGTGYLPLDEGAPGEARIGDGELGCAATRSKTALSDAIRCGMHRAGLEMNPHLFRHAIAERGHRRCGAAARRPRASPGSVVDRSAGR